MQKIACREYAATHQDWEIIDEISEKGVSGYKVSTNARDAIIEIKKRAMAKEFDVLLVFMFDRLGRREDETPFVVQWFVQQGMLTEQTVYIMKKRSCGEDLNTPGEKTKKKKVPDFSRTFLDWWSQQDSNL